MQGNTFVDKVNFFYEINKLYRASGKQSINIKSKFTRPSFAKCDSKRFSNVKVSLLNLLKVSS